MSDFVRYLPQFLSFHSAITTSKPVVLCLYIRSPQTVGTTPSGLACCLKKLLFFKKGLRFVSGDDKSELVTAKIWIYKKKGRIVC